MSHLHKQMTWEDFQTKTTYYKEQEYPILYSRYKVNNATASTSYIRCDQDILATWWTTSMTNSDQGFSRHANYGVYQSKYLE